MMVFLGGGGGIGGGYPALGFPMIFLQMIIGPKVGVSSWSLQMELQWTGTRWAPSQLEVGL